MKLLTRSTAPDAKLGIVERTGYMLGNVGTALMNTIVASYVMFYYTDIMYLNAGIVGTLLLISRIFDGVTDIIMGAIVDHTHSKLGKGRVWMLRMCLPYALCGILMMSVPGSASDIIKYVYVFLTYNLCNTICLTAVYVPYNSMTYSLSSSPYERGLLGVFVMLGAVIGTMAVNSTIDTWTKALGNTAEAWRTVAIIYAVIGLLLHLVCFFTTKERYVPDASEGQAKPKLKDEIKSVLTNKYWLIAVLVVFLVMLFTNLVGSTGMYFAKTVMGDTAYYASIANAMSISQLLLLFLAFIPMKRFGKRKTALAGTLLIALGCLVQFFVGKSLIGTIICSLIRGMGAGLSGACGYGLVADTIDYGEWKTGIAASGIGMSSLTFVTKITGGLAGALVGLVINGSGYEAAAAVQSASAVTAVNLCFNVIPFVCVVAGSIALTFFKLDDIYPQIRKELDERKAKGASENA